MALVVAVVLGLLSFSSYSAAAVTTQTTMVAVALAQTTVAVAKKFHKYNKKGDSIELK